MQQQMKIIGSECYYLSGIAARLIGPAHLCQNPSVSVTVNTISTTPTPETFSPQQKMLQEELKSYYNSKNKDENNSAGLWATLKAVPWIKQLLQHEQ